jgi:geranylgeranyl pyrophosphate synthase
LESESWPSSPEVNVAVGQRVRLVLEEHGGAVGEVGLRVLREKNRVLANDAHSLTAVLVAGTCLSAGDGWRTALWPAAAAELMMAAADVFDDVADLDPDSEATRSPGRLLTAAAGLLALSGTAVLRVVDDGASSCTAVALGQLLGTEFARAANGQAASLDATPSDALTAYQQSSAKSGPLGSLIARLGARTATDQPELVDLYADFGWWLAVRSQLTNDIRDVGSPLKSDVRVGAPTVPLTFAGSRGAPPDLSGEALEAWETRERQRIANAGGLAAAIALAEAARLRAVNALDTLEARARPVAGLRQLLD